MVKVKRAYVLGAAVCSLVAMALSLTSIATDNWVQADIKPDDSSVSATSHIRYGLFTGTLTQVFSAGDKTAFTVTMTCLFGENACAMLCRNTTEQRESELQDLIDGEAVTSFSCPFFVKKTYSTRIMGYSPNPNARASNKRVFIDSACYLTTVIFLSISICCGVISSALLVWNVAGNPVQTLFSIYSLYYYVGAAAVTALIAVIVWGALFATFIMENVGILYTLNGQFRYEGNPILDYSYWLNIGAFVFYMTSLGLLMTRKYLMDNENLIMRNINQGNQVIF